MINEESKKEYVLKNRILNVKVGSHLYGTSTAESDNDFHGIYLPSKENILGLHYGNLETSFDEVSKTEDGKNDSDAVDSKYYDIRKFLSLAIKGKFNVIELLFANEENIEYINDVGRELMSNYEWFVSKDAIKSTLGFSRAQKKKMTRRTKVSSELALALSILSSIMADGQGDLVLTQCHDVKGFQEAFNLMDDRSVNYEVADRKIVKNQTVKRARRIIEKMMKSSNRYDIVSEHGYDTKYAGNVIRALVQAEELLDTGKIVYPLQKKDLIIAIKDGKLSIEHIVEMADDMEERILKKLKTSDLKDKSDYDKINDFLIRTLRDKIVYYS